MMTTGPSSNEVYFGVNGEPVLSGREVCPHQHYDRQAWPSGRVGLFRGSGRTGDYGPEGCPFHRLRRILDERGNELESATFGTDGEPLEVLDATSGRRCAKLIRRFDATNKEIDSACFDAAGNPTSGSE